MVNLAMDLSRDQCSSLVSGKGLLVLLYAVPLVLSDPGSPVVQVFTYLPFLGACNRATPQWPGIAGHRPAVMLSRHGNLLTSSSITTALRGVVEILEFRGTWHSTGVSLTNQGSVIRLTSRSTTCPQAITPWS